MNEGGKFKCPESKKIYAFPKIKVVSLRAKEMNRETRPYTIFEMISQIICPDCSRTISYAMRTFLERDGEEMRA